MRSKPLSGKIPHRLYEAYEKLAERCGYPNVWALMIWNPFYALMVNANHSLTASIANMSPEAQDQIIEEVVSNFEQNNFSHGSYFERTLREAVERLQLPISAEVLETLVAELARKPRKIKQ